MAGTGLPIPKAGVIAQTPGIADGDALVSTGAWAKIASAGQRLASLGADALQRDEHLAQVARAADRDVSDRRKAIELEDKFADNPAGFEAGWKGYTEGVLSQTTGRDADAVRLSLGTLGNSAYARILERKRGRDRSANVEKIEALVSSANDELGSIAMRGGLGLPEGHAAATKLKNVLDAAVTSGVLTQERADLRFRQATSDAAAEGALFAAREVYDANRASGGDALAAARKVVDEQIVNNPALALSPAVRRAYASKITAELGADEALRRQDLGAARQAARDAQNALAAGVKVSPETVDSLADTLAANGGQADAARLRASALRADRMAAYGKVPIGDSVAPAFSPEHRTFVFAASTDGVEAWLRLQDAYGAGQNVIGVLTGHLNRMATAIALAEVVGPNHGASMRAALKLAAEDEAKLSTVGRMKPLRMLESGSIARRTYDVLTGRSNAVDGPLMAGIFGGLRSLNVAAKLDGAVVSAVPGDSVTVGLAASYNGMAPGRILSGVLREIARGGEDSAALASRLQLTAHAAMDYAHGFSRFTDDVAGPQVLRAMANVVIRAQGLAAWTDLMKRTFTMELAGHLADHARHSLADLASVNRPLANFLERHQIDATEWDAVRKTRPVEVDGATFLDMEAIEDRRLAEKLLGAIVEERAFAVLEPDARIRAITTGGTTAGAFWGEMVRSATLFKSFSITMIATHLMRIATQGPIEARVWNGAAFVMFNMLAGAAAIQAKGFLAGKEPESMGSAAFWARAGLQSGSLGVYGDLINASSSRTGRSFVADLAGPAIGAAEYFARLSSQQLRRLMEGADTTMGAELVRTARRYDPGTWYTRLAVDRLLFDQIQTLVDPDYRDSFRRQEPAAERDFGQRFWWAPGDALPEGTR